jgi:hypothetical protein
VHLPSPRSLLTCLLLMAVAGGVTVWWLHDAPALQALGVSGIERDAPVSTGTLDVAAAVVAEPVVVPAIAHEAAVPAPLPATLAASEAALPIDADTLPVLDLLELLEHAALAGDVVASCTLSQALGECARHRELDRMRIPPPGRGATREAIDIHVEEEARREEALARLAPRCAGIGLAHLAQRMAFTTQAARAGHVASLLGVVAAKPADFVRHPQLAPMYRSEVWPLLRAAMASGHRDAALTAMFQLQDPANSPLFSAVPEEFQNPWAARAVIQMVYPRTQQQREPGGPQPSAEARATARRWVDDLMGGVLPAPTAPGWRFRQAREDEACDNPANWIAPAA